MLPAYSRVRLLSNRFASEGLQAGDVGYIIEVYSDDDYEVEFSAPDGSTVAMVVAHSAELQLCEEAETHRQDS